jgi:very-short-patch-repair endonuclease
MRRARPWRTNRARALRSNATSAEGRLWRELRSRRLNGAKFVRQCPIGPLFADFACRELKIIVEIDGGTHSSEGELARDRARAASLEAQGFRIFRAHNREIYDNLEGVLEALLAFIDGTIE